MPLSRLIALALLALAGPARASSFGPAACVASVYWEGFGRPLADGRRHKPDELLAAHRTLPFGTRLRVTVVANGAKGDGRTDIRILRSAVVRIADRGPYVKGRCLDLSRGAARVLGVDGLARVTLVPVAAPIAATTSDQSIRVGR